MRIFLDTNVLVSAYAARGICTDLVRFILAESEVGSVLDFALSNQAPASSECKVKN